MEEEKKKTTFLFVFLTHIPMFLLKFRSRELVGCRIKFRIQRVSTRHTFDGPCYPKNNIYLKKCDDDDQQVPTWHTFDGPRYPKNNKYLKKCDDDVIITFFQVFIVFGRAGSVKSMQCGYSLDVELNSTSNELFRSELE